MADDGHYKSRMQWFFSDEFKEERLFHFDCVFQTKNLMASKHHRETGNELFNHKNHTPEIHKKILMNYCKSIAFAPSDSEDLVLAFGNRSFLFLHLRKYQECIVDIDYALKLNIAQSEAFKIKLLCRKVLCLNLLNKKLDSTKVYNEAKSILSANFDIKKEDKKKLLIKLNEAFSAKPDKLDSDDCLSRTFLEYDLPFISEAISLKYNKKFGKHFAANRDIKTGEIILIDKAYCAHPQLKELYVVCSHCLKQNWNSIPCGNCVFAMYCSIECKNEAFEKYHDIECSIYPFIFKHLTTLRQLQLTRLFITAIKEVGMQELIREAKVDKVNDARNSKRPEEIFLLKDILADCNKYKFCKYLLESPDYRVTNNYVLKEGESAYPTHLLNIFENMPIFEKDEIFVGNKQLFHDLLIKLSYKCSINNYAVEYLDATTYLSKESAETSECSTACGAMTTTISCFFNHNCINNIERIHLEGPRMLFYASRPIKKNEQLYTSYGTNYYISEKGNKEKDKYDFFCNCIACKENWPDLNDVNKINSYMLNIDPKRFQKTMDKLEDSDLKHLICNWKTKIGSNKNPINEVSKLIDIMYSNLSTFEATIMSKPYKTILQAYFTLKYGFNYSIPSNCR